MRIIAMVGTLGSVATLIIATPAMAKPTYLACTLIIDDQPQQINFTADEQAGTAAILIGSSGASRTVKGTFTPDKVIVDEPSARWEISRTSLNFNRTIKMISSTDRGQCKMLSVPKRAF